MPDYRPPHIPASEITSNEVYVSRRHFIGAAVATLSVSGLASAAVTSATQAQGPTLMIGPAIHDFNQDSNPSIPGYDWNEG